VLTNQLRELPNNWKWTKLGEITEINPKNNYSHINPNLAVTFIPMAAVDEKTGKITSPQIRPLVEIKKGYTSFKNNDVIFARITPCMENGKMAIAESLENGIGFGSTEFFVIRPGEKILPKYLYYFLRQESFRNFAKAHMVSSVGLLRVPKQIMEEVYFPLAPIEEQKNIVKEIDELLADIAVVHQHLGKLNPLLKKLHHSILYHAFTGKLVRFRANPENSQEPYSEIENTKQLRQTLDADINLDKDNETNKIYNNEIFEIPDSWKWIKLKEIAESMKNGIYKPPDFYSNDGVACLRMYNIENGSIA
jgi:type I restriction enzyme S subunit